jgi:hypothetical protein
MREGFAVRFWYQEVQPARERMRCSCDGNLKTITSCARSGICQLFSVDDTP